MNFPDLPVCRVFPEIREKLRSGNILLLSAQPGAGKSTVTPLALLEEPYLRDGKIIMLEPRRVAAKALAERMSEIAGTKLGGLVGYRTGLQSACSSETKIEIVTEGIFTRMIQSDPSLEGIGVVIFDEFHERSVHTDLGLALLLDAQPVFRPDLKILIMSATLNTDEIRELLPEAAQVYAEGRSYPVSVLYSQDKPESEMESETAAAVYSAVLTLSGDILVFLPGEGEIRRTMTLFRKTAEAHALDCGNLDLIPLYGSLPAEQQDRAIRKADTEKRRIIFATSLAETSLTIPGIRVVIDSGFTRK